jgi:hypothetical protein
MYAILLGPVESLEGSPLDYETHTYQSRIPLLFNIRTGLLL